MTDAGEGGRRLTQRPRQAARIGAVAAIIILLLYAGGLLPATAAVVGLAAVVVVAAFLAGGRSTATDGAAPAESSTELAPRTGIGLFAEALPDPCFVLDRHGIVRYANKHASAVFPIPPGEPLAFRLRVPELTAAFERVAAGGPPERVEFSERVPTERWFAAWFAGLDKGDDAGGRDFVVLVLDDLSQWRLMDRIRVDFVANASHELRTPLASLAGFIETLQGPARDDAAARERFLPIMHDQAKRMKRLIDDLLSLSRIELRVHVPPSGTVELAPLVGHAVDALEPLARDLGVEIECHLPEAALSVVGERDELIQVFENLIENAIKYGEAGKRIVVTLTPPEGDDGATVSVRDFGAGIAEEHLPRLTERFYRIDVEASRRHKGTGLGLAIVKHILTRHGARLRIDSRLGEGATFSVVFALTKTKIFHKNQSPTLS